MNTVASLLQSKRVSGSGINTPLGQIHGAWMEAPDRRLGRGMRVSGQYGLVYLLDGSGIYRNPSGISRRVQSGDLIVVTPNAPHSYGPRRGEHWADLDVIFTGPVFDFWLQCGIINLAQPIYHLEPIEQWLIEIMTWLEQPRPMTEDAALVDIAQFLTFLTKILTTKPGQMTGASPDWLERAVYELEFNLSVETRVNWVAETLGLSYETFRKLFEQHVGLPPGRYRTQKRMAVACRLLADTQMTNTEIAESLGYASPFSFSNQFKATIGTSPKEYRKSGRTNEAGKLVTTTA